MGYWDELYLWLDEKDQANGKVELTYSACDCSGSPTPILKNNKNDRLFVNAINTVVEDAKSGILFRKVEAILATAHCLKHGWSIPESLADYMSNALTDTAIAFGHTDGDIEKKYEAASKAMGLFIPIGRPKKSERDKIIYSYIKWRIGLFPKETLYRAAKHAETAFMGTIKLGKHKNLTRIYKEHETESDGAIYCPSIFALMADGFNIPSDMAFQDDDFVRATIPHISDNHPYKKVWIDKYLLNHKAIQ